MSEQKCIVDVFPKKINTSQESFQVHNFECPSCFGRGYHEERTPHGEWKRIACSRCDGAGRLKGTISVCWEPDYGC